MIFLLSVLSLLVCQAVLSPISNDAIFQYVDDHKDEFVQRLKDWVAVESDSSDPTKRDLVNNMMQITKDFILKLGGSVEMAEVGEQELQSGKKIPLPPVILAEIGNDTNKPTVCFYGHVDVQPANKADGWLTEPYTLVEKDGNLYGRGSSDDKGQVLALLHAVEAVNTIGLPVNVKFIIEGMEEVGSNGLDKLVEEKKDTFLSNVDYIVVTDTPWLSKKPGITYGARGNCYFFIEVQGARRDLHSGGFGGTVYEAMSDLIYLLDTLVDAKGHIRIPGIYDGVVPLTEKEIKLYKDLEFKLDELQADTGVTRFLHDTKEELLMYRWRYPSLSIHGIEGAFSGSGTKTVIPAKVIGKFSIRQVPNMNPSVVEKQVVDYLESKFSERKSPNKMKVSMIIGAKPWLADMNEPQYVAARKAVKRVFNTDADMIRAGGTIPIAKNFEEVLKKSVMLLGIGGPDDAPHGQNEKISMYNYIEGTKLYASFLQELASQKAP
ncbi:beta-Ala-His dipeptidase-like [Spea bombifrons]|uniref:beta-Ala-His dipeptidase-like n=1 Tax=Spea bombifrons TaxID=233779 RepID=UPI00234AA661|nr:beta-Ala-His dipeptidase-like [Spea bombifrons]